MKKVIYQIMDDGTVQKADGTELIISNGFFGRQYNGQSYGKPIVLTIENTVLEDKTGINILNNTDPDIIVTFQRKKFKGEETPTDFYKYIANHRVEIGFIFSTSTNMDQACKSLMVTNGKFSELIMFPLENRFNADWLFASKTWFILDEDCVIIPEVILAGSRLVLTLYPEL